MADASNYYQVRTLVVGTTTWVPVICPVDCSEVTVKNTDTQNAILARTDKDDVSTQQTVGAGATLDIPTRGSTTAFTRGSTVVWLLAAAGSIVCVQEFIR